MPNVTFIEHSGEARTVAIRNGTNLMEGGVLGGVSGIEADCGGARLCGTCQVLVPDEWVDLKSLVGPPARIKERYRAWEDSGADSLSVRSRQPEAIEVMAQAARLN